ncbi:hypothetical protein D3C85_653730 [compost metagenome]
MPFLKSIGCLLASSAMTPFLLSCLSELFDNRPILHVILDPWAQSVSESLSAICPNTFANRCASTVEDESLETEKFSTKLTNILVGPKKPASNAPPTPKRDTRPIMPPRFLAMPTAFRSLGLLICLPLSPPAISVFQPPAASSSLMILSKLRLYALCCSWS